MTYVCSDTAASVESLQCIQIQQTYGADFGMKSVHGATPMHKVTASGHTAVPNIRRECSIGVVKSTYQSLSILYKCLPSNTKSSQLLNSLQSLRPQPSYHGLPFSWRSPAGGTVQ